MYVTHVGWLWSGILIYAFNFIRIYVLIHSMCLPLRHIRCAWILNACYGVALVSMIDKIICLFCKRALQKSRYSARETYNLIDPSVHHVYFMCVHEMYVLVYVCKCAQPRLHIYVNEVLSVSLRHIRFQVICMCVHITYVHVCVHARMCSTSSTYVCE